MDNKAIALTLNTLALSLRVIADSLSMAANQLTERGKLPEFHELPEAGMVKTDRGWRHP